MGKVVVYMSMSLDGFIAGPNDSIAQPLGEGGSVLHEWLFDGNIASKHNDFFQLLSRKSRGVFDESFETAGAIVVGRRTYDVVGGWGGNHPIHGVPVFVLTHHIPSPTPNGSTSFTFVTDGIESAIEQANAAADDKNVSVGGAHIVQQCINAGLLDEIHVHLVPVLLGSGIRLFDLSGDDSVRLEKTRVIESPDVTHLTFRIIK
ncbi:dihydrofolate reductase [Salicibibacter cibarius]|uniref:Dihydrofolate reductase n=1 Tax=Salicibibacter cibarius TaxID=2743000 RepID=A0A7T7CAG2_9BACI|nr:dihydrofolate reductase family protein [Salicibibacter cibarius]QQK74867.1 dihydrofolate reductase [Salicibibacter cibarius]